MRERFPPKSVHDCPPPLGIQAQFLATGRLEKRVVVLRQMAKALLYWQHRPQQQTPASAALERLARACHPSGSTALFLAELAPELASAQVARAVDSLCLELPTLADVLGQQLLPRLLAQRRSAAESQAPRAQWVTNTTSSFHTLLDHLSTARSMAKSWETKAREHWAAPWRGCLRQCLRGLAGWAGELAVAEGEGQEKQRQEQDDEVGAVVALVGRVAGAALGLHRDMVGQVQADQQAAVAAAGEAIAAACAAIEALRPAAVRAGLRFPFLLIGFGG